MQNRRHGLISIFLGSNKLKNLKFKMAAMHELHNILWAQKLRNQSHKKCAGHFTEI